MSRAGFRPVRRAPRVLLLLLLLLLLLQLEVASWEEVVELVVVVVVALVLVLLPMGLLGSCGVCGEGGGLFHDAWLLKLLILTDFCVVVDCLYSLSFFLSEMFAGCNRIVRNIGWRR